MVKQPGGQTARWSNENAAAAVEGGSGDWTFGPATRAPAEAVDGIEARGEAHTSAHSPQRGRASERLGGVGVERVGERAAGVERTSQRESRGGRGGREGERARLGGVGVEQARERE